MEIERLDWRVNMKTKITIELWWHFQETIGYWVSVFRGTLIKVY